MKGGKGLSDRDKIMGIVVMSVLTVIASITCGFVLNKEPENVPAIEIIDIIEPKEAETTAGTVSAVAETSAAAEVVTADTEISFSEETVSVQESGGLININTASADSLMELKGVGEKTAAAIIDYRENTPFRSIEEIKNVKGIGEKKFEDIKDHICV